MIQTVLVTSLLPDGRARVLHLRQSACSGDCHQCSGCGAAQEALLVTAENPIGAKPGDMVQIQSESGPVLLGAMVLYLLPLALFFLGYALGAVLWQKGALAGCLAFGLGILLCVGYDRWIAKKPEPVYTIQGFVKRSH